MMQEEIKAISDSPRDLRSFGALVGGILLGLGAWYFYSGTHDWRPVTAIGAALAITGLLAPRLLRHVYRAWMILGLAIGFVMTRVILFILFAIILTPIALLMRILGKRPLDLRFKPVPAPKSYWNVRVSSRSSRAQMERQF